MGCKTCIEKLFGVEIGPRGFRSGIPPPLIPGFVLIFFGIFFVVGGILLCILHQTYIVARHDQLYETDNYFLVAGVVSLCLGVIICFIGTGWCYHSHTTRAERIEDYKLRKGYSSENVNKYADSVSAISDTHSINRTLSNSDYPQGDRHNRYSESQMSMSSYPHGQRHDRYSQGQMAHMSYPESYPYPEDPQSSPQDGVATRISRGASKGFDDFKAFVKRNQEASRSDLPRKRPYSERLSRPSQGYANDDEFAQAHGHHGRERYASEIEDAEFNLARTYIQNPEKYYAEEETHRLEDKQSGYEIMPADDPQRRHQSRGRYPSDVTTNVNNGNHPTRDTDTTQPPNPAKRSAAYRYDKGRPLDSSQDSNPPGRNPAVAQNQTQPKYRYEKGRPLDSSQDSNQSFGTDSSVSMATAGAPAPAMVPPQKEAGKEKATLVYNPKDGQWYYYYKGKPISKYDPDMKGAGPQGGPVYKYINGKPVLLPHPPDMP